MDMMTRCALVAILRLHPKSLVLLAPVCSGFSFMSSSQAMRFFYAPLGNEQYPWVKSGNVMSCRVTLLRWLCCALGHVFILEQPSSARFGFMPRWRYFCDNIAYGGFPAAKILYMCKPKPRKKVMSLEHSKTKKLQIISTRTIGKIVQKSEYFIPRPISKTGMLAKPRGKIFDQKLQVFRETIMMRHYGVQSLKPTCLWSNSYHLRDLNEPWTFAREAEINMCGTGNDLHWCTWCEALCRAKRKFWKPVRHLTIVYRVVTYTPL